MIRTLLADHDRQYDPCDYSDRLLLGLSGIMSEAELHVIRARLIGGMLNKAKRGELKMRLPVGFVCTALADWLTKLVFINQSVIFKPMESLSMFFILFSRSFYGIRIGPTVESERRE